MTQHALTAKPQAEDHEDQHDRRDDKGHAERGHRQACDRCGGDAGKLLAVGELAEPDESSGAGQRRDCVDGPEIAMTEIECIPQVTGEERDEIGLAETRRNAEQEARAQPTHIVS